MAIVDVSKIPNNSKFDPVREAILELEGNIVSGIAGVSSINGEQGAVTISAGPNVSVSTSEGVITISSSAGTPNDGQLLLVAGAGITTDDANVFQEEVLSWSTNDRIWTEDQQNIFSANAANDLAFTIRHADTSSITDKANTGGNVIQSMTFDEFGHVKTAESTDLDSRYVQLTDSRIAEWDDAYDNTITGASFSTTTGVLTLTQRDLGTVTVDLDGKYLNIADKAADSDLLDGLDSAYFLDYNNLNNTPTITTYTAGLGLTLIGSEFSHADTSTQSSVNNSGATFIQDVTLDTYGHVTGLASATVSIPTVNNATITISAGTSMAGGGAFTTNQSFNETITISHGDTSTLNGTYGSTDDAVKIDTITVDANGHVTSITTGPVSGGGGTTPNNATITIAAGTAMTGGGAFTTDQSFNETITLSHADTSTLSGTYGSTDDAIKIDTITVDANGHITAITTGAVSGGGGTIPTLDQVTSAGNISSSSISVFKSIAPSYPLDVGGTIRAQGDVIAFSDIRVKENIVTIENALDKVLNLRGVEYNKIDESIKSIGVIAQEVEKVLPQVVRDDEEGMKSVAYGNMVGLLIEAIKEQQKQIEELKSLIDGGTK